MIAEDIKEQAGAGRRTSAWYVNALETALSNLQVEDSDTIDTGGITLGSLFFFSYSVHVPFSGLQMLAEKNFPRHGVAFSRSAMTVGG